MRQELNSHNTFIQIFLECGILGFVLVLGMFYHLIGAFIKQKNQQLHFGSLFTLIVLVVFLFESMLNRFSGIAFFMFFYSLLINRYQNVGKN